MQLAGPLRERVCRVAQPVVSRHGGVDVSGGRWCGGVAVDVKGLDHLGERAGRGERLSQARGCLDPWMKDGVTMWKRP